MYNYLKINIDTNNITLKITLLMIISIMITMIMKLTMIKIQKSSLLTIPSGREV